MELFTGQDIFITVCSLRTCDFEVISAILKIPCDKEDMSHSYHCGLKIGAWTLFSTSAFSKSSGPNDNKI